MLIGYFRPHDDAVEQAVQRRALAEAGCGQVVEERPGAEDHDEQPELLALLGRLRAGDVVVVPQLDALGQASADLARRVRHLAAAGAGLRSLAEAIEIPAPRDGAVSAAAAAGLPAPGGAGAAQPDTSADRRRAGGRPPKLSRGQQAEIAARVLAGRDIAADMARLHRVSEATISRVLAAARAGALALAAPMSGGQAEEGAGHPDWIAGLPKRGAFAAGLPDSALDDRLAIVGLSGSGKTYAAKGLVERLLDRRARVCVVDPLGVWWGLREAADGTPAPHPVTVFGGSRADVPLDPGTGAALGRLIGSHAVACVVDISDLGSAAALRAFMKAFAGALYTANTEPLHLVLDEADLWAPQRVPPDGRELLGRVEEIVRRGRVRGFVPWLITQRPAVLHKDVLSQADVLVAMKLTSSQDRAALGRWLEGQADRAEGQRVLADLPRLRRGEGWVWAPGHGVLDRVSFPRIRTLDSSQTPRWDPQAGPGRALPSLNLSATRKALAAAADTSGA